MGWTLLTVIAFYLGAVNTLLAEYTGTCTQGNADHMDGIILSAILFLLGCFFLFKSKFILLASALCAPVFVLILWKAAFAFSFSYSIFVLHRTACDVLSGIAYPPSGKELQFAIFWMTFGISVPTAITVTYIGQYLRWKKQSN